MSGWCLLLRCTLFEVKPNDLLRNPMVLRLSSQSLSMKPPTGRSSMLTELSPTAEEALKVACARVTADHFRELDKIVGNSPMADAQRAVLTWKHARAIEWCRARVLRNARRREQERAFRHSHRISRRTALARLRTEEIKPTGPLRLHRRWTPEEDQILLTPGLSYMEIAKRLRKSISACQSRRWVLANPEIARIRNLAAAAARRAGQTGSCSSIAECPTS